VQTLRSSEVAMRTLCGEELAGSCVNTKQLYLKHSQYYFNFTNFSAKEKNLMVMVTLCDTKSVM